MKKILLTLSLFCFNFNLFSQAFITVWNTENAGISNNNQITIPNQGGTFNYSVYWEEEGNPTNFGSVNDVQAVDLTITFPSPGIYRVEITGQFPNMYFFNGPAKDNLKLIEMRQWGNIQWASFAHMFYGCSNMNYTATDNPITTNATSMIGLFWGVPNINGDITNWNTFYITDMRSTFQQSSNFNQDISAWDVSNVTLFSSMFRDATSFNNNISGWNVGSATDMSLMFYGANSFNIDISGWSVSNVVNMSNMFGWNTAFNQDLSTWNVGNVQNFSNMFQLASSFNQNLGAWNMSAATNLAGMFQGASLSTCNYDGILNGWTSQILNNGLNFHAGGAQYSPAAQDARGTLVGLGWTITDGGLGAFSYTVAVNETSPISCIGYSDGELEAVPVGGQEPYSFSWYDEFENVLGESSLVSSLSAGTYRVEVEDNTGCISIEEYILEDPDPIEATITNVVTEVCSNADIDLTATLSGSADEGEWRITTGQGTGPENSGSVSVTTDNAGVWTATFTPNGSYFGNVSFQFAASKSGSGCAEFIDDINIFIQQEPTVNAGTDATICEGDVFNLTVSNPSAGNYTSLLWQTSGDGGFVDDQVLEPTYIPGVGDISVGFVTLTLTAVGNGVCANAIDDMLLTITPQPSAGSYIGTPGQACTTDISFDLTGTLDGNQDAGGSWTYVSGPTALSPSGDFIDFSFAPSGLYEFEYYVTGGGTCADVFEVVFVELNPSPLINFPPPSELTFYESQGNIDLSTFTSQITVTGADTYNWTIYAGAGDFQPGSQFNLYPVYQPVAADFSSGQVILQLEATSPQGCLITEQLTLNLSNSPDYDVLVDLYNALDGANWSNNINWLEYGVSIDQWHGIITENDRVNNISFGYNNLTGTIPASIGDLTELITLSLQGNNITGSIPISIGNLGNLNTLGLQENSLSGSIPEELGNLTSLSYLNLGYNNFSGSIPTSFSGLTSLNVLRAPDAGISGQLPDIFGGMSSLSIVELNFNSFEGVVPASLTTNASVGEIYLNNNFFDGLGSINLPSLTYFDLIYNNLEFDAIEPIAGLPNIAFDPQNLIQLAVQTSVYEGTQFSLDATVGGAENNYYWYFDNGGGFTEISTNPILEIPEVATSDGGTYYYEITNDIVNLSSAGFALVSTELQLIVLPKPNRPTINQLTALSANEVFIEFTLDDGVAFDGFELRRATAIEGPYNVVVSLADPLGVDYQDDTADPLTTYWYQLYQYINDNGDFVYSDASDPVSVTTLSDEITLADFQVLQAIYDDLDGANWVGLTQPWFESGIPVSMWTGIAIEGDRVVGIDLRNFNATGLFPNIDALDALQSFMIGGNTFSSLSNINFSNHPNLYVLMLNEMSLTDPALPNGIFDLTNLEYINLSGNSPSLIGEIPLSASGWSQPWSIEIRDTDISGEIFSVINDGSSLEYLDLSRNAFTGNLPDFTNYTLLTELNLPGNNFDGEVPESIGLLTNLITIDLSGNNLSGSLPLSMANLTNLEFFNINDNNFSGSFPDFISNWENIAVIQAANNNFSGEINDDWSGLTQFIGAALSNNNLEGAFPQVNSTVFKALYIDGNNFSSLPIFPNFDFSDSPELLLQNNKLTFVDLEQFVDPSLIEGDNFFYSPQQTLAEPIADYVLEGDSYVLNASPISGTSLSYQWYKDDVAVTDSTISTFTILNFSVADEGTYRVEATSSLLPALTSVGPDISLILNDFLVDPQDSLALVAFYNATNGESWTNNSGWLTGNVEDWFGVSVTGNRVSSLVLESNNLNGFLPNEIGDLAGLLTLNLNFNLVSGNLPESLANLSLLTSLNLRSNLLSGILPTQIGQLSSLNVLDLGDNEFSGNIPSEMGDLISLGFLYLFNNQFSGGVPVSLASLSSLEFLFIESNQITQIPDFSSIAGLTQLNVSNNAIGIIDLETNAGVPNFLYWPQELSNIEIISVDPVLGETLELSIDPVAGSANQYQWQKNDVLISGETNPVYTINEFGIPDQAFYRLRITNSLLSDIDLLSGEFFAQLADCGEYTSQIPVDKPWYAYTTRGSLGNFGDNDFVKIDTTAAANQYTISDYTAGFYKSFGGAQNVPGSFVDNCGNLVLNINNGSFGQVQGVYGQYDPAGDSLILRWRDVNNDFEEIVVFKQYASAPVANETDSLALVAFFNSLDSTNNFWVNNSNWLTTPFWKWDGIAISQTGRVKSLQLPNRGLSGDLSQLLALDSLEVLDIVNNQFFDLPDFTVLPNFTELSVQGNNFNFLDLIPNLPIQEFNYQFQRPFGLVDVVVKEIGEDFIISANTVGTGNLYQWRKNNVIIEGATDTLLVINNVTIQDGADYRLTVTNDLVPNLTLQSNPISLTVKSESIFEWADGGDLTNDGFEGRIYSGSWGDFDGDGYDDIFTMGFGVTEKGYLYRNNQDGTFSKMPENTFDFATARSVTWADYDNDGLLDVFVPSVNFGTTLSDFTASIYKNLGNGSFERLMVSDSAVGSGVWIDIDNNGYLDLVGNGSVVNQTVLNPALNEVPFDVINLVDKGGQWNIVSVDLNNNGHLDLILPDNPQGKINVYFNNGDGTFTEMVGQELVDTYLGSLRGVSVADIDNDGDYDIYVQNAIASGTENLFFINDGSGNFTGLSSAIVLGEAIRGGRASTFVDVNNDGYRDLITSLLVNNVPNLGVFINNGDLTFTKDELQTFQKAQFELTGVSTADFDNDGFQDFFIGNGSNQDAYKNSLYRNRGNGNNWLQINLEGRQTNRSGIGSKIDVYTNGTGRHQQVITSNGNHNQNSLTAHFGLTAFTNVDSVVVNWASGHRQTLYDVTANQKIRIIENIINTNDSLALVAIYNALDGPNWTNNDNWLSGTIDTWFGVSVEDFQVKSLGLFSNNLTGQIPTEIGQLTNLEFIELGFNNISGSLPETIGNLSNLQELRLYGNTITGPLPLGLFDLTNLRILHMEQNQVGGSIPTEIGNLINLEELNLGENELIGAIPGELGQLVNLQTLTLRNNQLEGAIPATFSQLTLLSSLYLNSNQLSGAIDPIYNLNSLIYLALNENSLSGELTEDLGNLILLDHLYLGQNEFTGILPNALGTLTSLTELDLANNNFEGAFPPSVVNIPNLWRLFVWDNQLTSIPDFSGMDSLTELAVSNNRLGFDQLEPNVVIPTFDYAGQVIELPTLELEELLLGNSFSVDVSIPGVNNEYLWIRNGIDTVSTSAVFAIDTLRDIDNDNYHVEIRNSLLPTLEFMVPGLEIRTNPPAPNELIVLQNDEAGIMLEVVFDEPKAVIEQGVIERATILEGPYSAIASISEPPAIFTDTDVVPSTTYFYRAYFTNNIGDSEFTTLEVTAFEEQFQVSEQDSLALVAFYQALDGDNWINNTGWLQEDVINWFGIELNDNFNIIGLNLPNNNLAGVVPTGFGTLNELSSINLSENQLTSLPVSTGFNNMSLFDVSNNFLDFGDLEPYAGKNITNFIVSPQAKIGTPITELATYNAAFDYEQVSAGTANQYQWYFNGEILSGQNNATLTIAEISPATDGDYVLQVNSSIPRLASLTLVSEPITILFTTLEADSLVLVQLYHNTNGAAWTNRTNWLQGNVSTWHGVSVTENRFVSGLNLSTNGLQGTLPPDWGGLAFIETLNLSVNQIAGSLSIDAATLPELSDVNLRENDITSLSGFDQLPVLNSINVVDNRLSFGDLEPLIGVAGFNFAPQRVILLPADTVMNIGDNVTFFPAISGSQNSYQWLRDGAPIAGATDPAYTLLNLTTAEEGFYSLEVNSAIPELEDLTIRTSAVELKISTLIRDMNALRAVYNATGGENWTTNWNINQTDIANWGAGATITVQDNRVTGLNISNNNVVGDIPQALRELLSLTSINLSNNQITNVPNLTNIPVLTNLNVSGNRLTYPSITRNISIPNFNFANQAPIRVNDVANAIVNVRVGDNANLFVNTPGAANTYQWFFNGTAIAGATNSSYVINDVNFAKMGLYNVQVGNTVVNAVAPDFRLTGQNARLNAFTDIAGRAEDRNANPVTAGIARLFRITSTGGYDTVRFNNQSFVNLQNDGSFEMPDVILGNYLMFTRPSTQVFPDLLPTYYPNTIDWDAAQVIEVREQNQPVTIVVEGTPAPPTGNSVVSGILEEEFDEEDGRMLNRRAVSGAGASIRVASSTVRDYARVLADDGFQLVAYVETNAQGQFNFPNLPAGTYRLRIDYPGVPMNLDSEVEFELRGVQGEELELNAVVVDGEINVERARYLSVEELSKEQNLKIFPNPAADLVKIQSMHSASGIRTLRLFDNAGKLILQTVTEFHNGEAELNLEGISPGLYHVNITLNDGKIAYLEFGKLIKK